MSMTFDTKIVVVVRSDLAVWQKLNVTAFTISGIAGTVPGVMGEPYVDGADHDYLPMLKQPVMIYEADSEAIQRTFERAQRREVPMTIYTEILFTTGNDVDNRASVRVDPDPGPHLVGLALRDRKKVVDKIVKGLKLHS